MDTSNFKEVFESPKVKELTAQVAALKEQLSEANKERAWVRRKLEIPEDTGFLSGDVTLAGTMHNVWSGYRGYHNYIAAEKCDDKMGKIARQSVEIDALEAEVMRLRSVMADVIKAHSYAGGTPVEVMSTPFTPTTLNALIEKVEKMTIERCASAKSGIPMGADETMVAVWYEQVIRALPIYQIKLEELLK